VRDGFEVIVVQNPTVSPCRRRGRHQARIAAAKHTVVLVGHSYGGAVITEAGNDPKVSSLVICRFRSDAGESVETLIANPPPGAPSADPPPEDGFLKLDSDKFAASFAADVDPATPGHGGLAGPWASSAWGRSRSRRGSRSQATISSRPTTT